MSSRRRSAPRAGEFPGDLVVPARGHPSIHSDSGAGRRSSDSNRIYEWEEVRSVSPLPASPPPPCLPPGGARPTPSDRACRGGPAGACARGGVRVWLETVLFIYSPAPGQRAQSGPHPHPRVSASPAPSQGL